MSNPYADADAGLVDEFHEHDQTCECGVDHGAGLGDNWYSMAVMFGPEFPLVREPMVRALEQRGIDPAVLDTIDADDRETWMALFVDLAVPNTHDHVEWNENARDASRWLGSEIVETLGPVFTFVQTLVDVGARLTQPHVDVVGEALDRLGQAIGTLGAIGVNPAVPDANYRLPEAQVNADCPTGNAPSTPKDLHNYHGEFARWVYRYNDEREQVAHDFEKAMHDTLAALPDDADHETSREALQTMHEEFQAKFLAIVDSVEGGGVRLDPVVETTGTVIEAPEAPDPSVFEEAEAPAG